jgi:predicted Zn finger-like uncharacterized protein
MPIRLECPACHARFRVGDEAAGRRGRCPKCQQPIQVPVPTPLPTAPLLEVADDSGQASDAAVPPVPGTNLVQEPDIYDLSDSDQPRYSASRVTARRQGARASTDAHREKAASKGSATVSGRTPAQILAAFGEKIRPIRPSLLYRFWILVVASIMVVLPLIYLGIIALVGYVMFWHATHNYVVFQNIRNVRGALLVYVGPLVVLGILIFFLCKPLFAPRQQRTRTRSLDPSQEPLLFAFVDGVCSAVGAPTPVRIDIDCAVNASASPEVGLFSLLRRRLVLTVGLPLVATLDLKQFAGVLAHEFGHFSQTRGMQLTYLVRSINAWFARLVYERDEWDATLESWSRGGQAGVMILANLARLAVWLTRKVLWVLMMTGHAVSCVMLRQMEFDADRYQARLVGSPMVESILRQLNLTLMAERGAMADLTESWKEGRLPDDLPRLIEANIAQLPPEALKAVDEMFAHGKTGLFDTHPSDKERAAAALTEDDPGIFHLQGPATELFRDFEGIAREATSDHYRGLLGPSFSPNQLIPVAEVVRGTENVQDGHKALERFCLGCFSAMRAIPLPAEFPAKPEDPKNLAGRLTRVRSELLAALPGYRAALKSHRETFGKAVNASAASVFLKTDFKFKPAEYGLTAPTPESARSAEQAAEREMKQQATVLTPFEDLLGERMTGALCLLQHDAVARKIEDAEGWRQEVQALYPVASFLSRRVSKSLLGVVQARFTLLTILQKYEGNEQNERLRNAILRGAQPLHERLVELSSALGGSLLYPFDHAQGDITLGRFVLPSVPDGNAVGDLLEVSESTMDRLTPLYARLMGRLSLAVEEVERALGLPPLEPPGETAPAEEEPILLT